MEKYVICIKIYLGLYYSLMIVLNEKIEFSIKYLRWFDLTRQLFIKHNI